MVGGRHRALGHSLQNAPSVESVLGARRALARRRALVRSLTGTRAAVSAHPRDDPMAHGTRRSHRRGFFSNVADVVH